MGKIFRLFDKIAFGTMMGIALGIVLSGCGASMVKKMVVKEQIIIPKKHKHHHRHYHRF